MSLFYVSTNGERDGRASHFHRNEDNANEVALQKNLRAANLGLETKYQVCETTDNNIEGKEIRD